VLAAAVGVVDQGVGRSAPRQGHLQGPQRQLGAQVIGHRPAHHAAREAVQHRRQVEPALPGADVGDIADPELVWMRRGEVPLHQVRQQCEGIPDGGAPVALGNASGEAGTAHQPRHPFAAVPVAADVQLRVDAGSTVRLSAARVDGGDALGEHDVGACPDNGSIDHW
jgi:hypothetical protein